MTSKADGKFNVVYTKTVAGTVSQEKIDKLRKFLKENPDCNEGIWNIELTAESPDEDYAKYLMLIHDTLEEQDLEMEIDEVTKI